MKIDLLDHGYVEFIEAWGTGKGGKLGDPDDNIMQHLNWDYEVGIIEAARQSTQGSFRGWEIDMKLLEMLHRNRHATPFEFAGMVLEVQAPIFVFREWHRHRTQSYNEMSARYAALPDLYYVPTVEDTRSRMRAGFNSKNKQLSGVADAKYNEAYIEEWLEDVKELYKLSESIYRAALANGIPKEMARITMPVGHYSRMRSSTCLRNWLSFLTLRLAPGVQGETRLYAQAVGECVKKTFPNTWKLFDSTTITG